SPATATRLGMVTTQLVNGLNLNTGADVDDFSFQNTRAGVYVVAATGGVRLRVFDAMGNTVGQGVGQVGVRIFRPRSSLFVEVTSPNGAPVPAYSLAIASV